MSDNIRKINISVLQALSQVENDEFSSLLFENMGGNTELALAIKEIQQEEKSAKTRAAAHEIQKLISAANDRVVQNVNSLRDCKALESKLRANLAQISRTRDYGYETMNFLPLVACLQNTDLGPGSKVPEGWVAKSPMAKQVIPRKK